MRLWASFKDEEAVQIACAAKSCGLKIDEFIWLTVVSGTMKVLYEANKSERKKDGTNTPANPWNVV